MMQSYWMQMTDTETVLELREMPVPEPGPAQLLVRMHAAALKRGEFVLGHGLHGKSGTWKAIGGEGAGEVVSVGAEVTAFKPGDRVMGRCTGAFSEYALIELAEAIAAPAALSWAEAASVPMTFLVSFDMLVLQGRLEAGEWLLINGVSSGVGVAALMLGKVLGAKVIGTSGSAAKLEALKPLGLDVALCTRSADFAPAVMKATGQRGADLAVNAVGGSVFAEDIRAGSLPWDMSTACCTPTWTSKHCTPSGSPCLASPTSCAASTNARPPSPASSRT
jgi:NADPH:quinone reductase